MRDIKYMEEYLKNNLMQERYIHTLGVRDTAIKLAKINGIDINKAEVAALSHDMAKNICKDDLIKIIEEENIQLSIDEEKTKAIWHAIVAPIIGRKIFEIDDEEILSAMRWHTTGKEDMTVLDKIIYLSDMIEPSRNFPGVEYLRELAEKDLDEAVLEALTHTIKYLLEKNQAIDVNTIKARNYLIYNK